MTKLRTVEGIEEIMDLAKSYARQYYLTAEENDSFENLKKKEEEIRQSIHQELQKAYTKGRSDEAKTCQGCQGRCEVELQKAYEQGVADEKERAYQEFMSMN